MPFCYPQSCSEAYIPKPFEEAPPAQDLNDYIEQSTIVVSRLQEVLHDSRRANSGETDLCLNQLANIELQGEKPTAEDIGQAYFERLFVAAIEPVNGHVDSDDLLAMRYQFDRDPNWAMVAKQKTLARRELAINANIDVSTIDIMLQHLDKLFDLEQAKDSE